MNDSIKHGLTKILTKYNGIVLGGNDFFYTEHLSRHPFVELLYLYGWHLKSLGVDTLFVENHYIDEPIQTRGFIGQLTYCAFLFDMRVVGIEFKGNFSQYEKYTGKQVGAKVTTIAYNEPERLLRLNRVVKDIVEHQQKEKWIVFCGMSHVNDTKSCAGIKTLLNVPGIGVQLADKDFFGKKDFIDGKYKRTPDYLIQIAPPEKYSARLYVDTNVLVVTYSLLYFFSGYRVVKGAERLSDLFPKEIVTVYPLWYNDLVEWIMKTDPELRIPDPELAASIAFDMTREVCSRNTMHQLRAGMNVEHMNQIVDTIVLWLEKDLSQDYKSLMRMIFLEKKTIPLGKNVFTQIKNKFHKQLSRAENHLCELFQIMKRLKLPLPETRVLNRLF